MEKLSKQTIDELTNFLYATGFELWNAGCTHRLQIGNDDGVRLCEASDPLHPQKIYKDFNKALASMQKQDESC